MMLPRADDDMVCVTRQTALGIIQGEPVPDCFPYLLPTCTSDMLGATACQARVHSTVLPFTPHVPGHGNSVQKRSRPAGNKVWGNRLPLRLLNPGKFAAI